MKLQEIYDFLDSISSFELCESWDNSGLLVGSFDQEIQKVYTSVDLDSDLAHHLEPNSLIVTHHPLIFKGLKKFHTDVYPSNIISTLIQKNCALIALHTNFDKTHLNRYVAEEILGFEIVSSVDFVCISHTKKSFDSLLKEIAGKLKLSSVRYVQAKKEVTTVAITTGSGMDMLPMLQCDLFLTGDIKYHQALEAKENGVSLIDIGHFESERYFAEILAKELQKIKIQAIISNSKNPFGFYTSD